MKLTAALVMATALAASPALAAEPAADNAPGSQTQEMQGRVGTGAEQNAPDKPESRGMSGDQYPTTTGAGGSPSPSHTMTSPQKQGEPKQGDTPRDGSTK